MTKTTQAVTDEMIKDFTDKLTPNKFISADELDEAMAYKNGIIKGLEYLREIYEPKLASLQSTLDTMRQERDEVDKKLEDIRAMIKGYVIDLFHDDCDVPHNRQLIAMNIIELFGYDKKEAYDFLSRSPRTAQAENKTKEI